MEYWNKIGRRKLRFQEKTEGTIQGEGYLVKTKPEKQSQMEVMCTEDLQFLTSTVTNVSYIE